MAVEQLLRGIDHQAVVGHRTPGVHAAAELNAPAEPRVEADAKEVRSPAGGPVPSGGDACQRAWGTAVDSERRPVGLGLGHIVRR